jgi:phosphoenolpyruvate phosphomutase
MENINGKTLIQRQISLLQQNGISDIVVVRGFEKEKFHHKDVNFVNDDEFEEHEQLGSLIAAESEIVGDILIIFGDIIFDSNILNQILDSNNDISIAVDLDWKESYRERTDNPIELAGKILLDGQKIIQLSERLSVEKKEFSTGEFLGIIKLTSNGSRILRDYLKKLKHHAGRFHDAESFKMAKLTDLLQHLIESNVEIKPIFVKGKWCEIDTPIDLERAKRLFQ